MTNWIEGIGLLAATLSTISFLPQALKITKDKSAEDISLGMYLLLATALSLWLIYGLFIGSLPLILSNSCTLLLVIWILALKIHLDRQNKR